MIRRILLSTTALLLLAGTGQALADDLLSSTDGRHEVCVGTRARPAVAVRGHLRLDPDEVVGLGTSRPALDVPSGVGGERAT